LTLFGKVLRENKSLFLFILLLVVFRGAVADWHPVPTGSMKPTILEGDVILQNKLAYDLKIPFTDIKIATLGEPKRGDIVVINSSAADKRLVKRLVGMPGDDIAIIGSRVFINGESAHYSTVSQSNIDALRHSDSERGLYLIESIQDGVGHIVNIERRSASRDFQLTVPEGEYFFMGDNRDNSADSRYYGTFPRDELRGRASRLLVSLNINDAYKPRFERFFASLR